jgi:pimeloyl-ACP methyl ester carboxylesterase
MVTEHPILLPSAALGRKVSVLCVCPPQVEQVLILLHGYQGSWAEIQCQLPLAAFAETHHALIAAPNFQNEYYISHPGFDVDTFLAEELPHALQDRFRPPAPLPYILAGFSMGGFGSVLVALHRPEQFQRVVSFGGAFIQRDVLIGNPEIVGHAGDLEVLAYFQTTFGPFDDLECSTARNPEAAAKAFPAETLHRPQFLLYCGEDDLLFPRNQRMAQVLQASHLPCQLVSIPNSGHGWECFVPAWQMWERTLH